MEAAQAKSRNEVIRELQKDAEAVASTRTTPPPRSNPTPPPTQPPAVQPAPAVQPPVTQPPPTVAPPVTPPPATQPPPTTKSTTKSRTPAPTTPPPASGALTSKQQRLVDLLEAYRTDKISPAEYHAQRAKILAEP